MAEHNFPLFPIFVRLQTRHRRQFFFHSKLFQRRNSDLRLEDRIWAPHDFTCYAAAAQEFYATTALHAIRTARHEFWHRSIVRHFILAGSMMTVVKFHNVADEIQ